MVKIRLLRGTTLLQNIAMCVMIHPWEVIEIVLNAIDTGKGQLIDLFYHAIGVAQQVQWADEVRQQPQHEEVLVCFMNKYIDLMRYVSDAAV